MAVSIRDATPVRLYGFQPGESQVTFILTVFLGGPPCRSTGRIRKIPIESGDFDQLVYGSMLFASALARLFRRTGVAELDTDQYRMSPWVIRTTVLVGLCRTFD
jgi:hypothetical protein